MKVWLVILMFSTAAACGAPAAATPTDSGGTTDSDAVGMDDASASDSGAVDTLGPDVTGLQRHCHERIGAPRVEQLADGLYVAIGFDLANTIVVETTDGLVVIDVSMSPSRAQEVKAAIFEVIDPAPVHAIIYTHSHIDHVGGASVWAEPQTEIWATDALMEHFLKQYGAFRKAETERARRQFAQHVGTDQVPCSALGRKPDLVAALSTGFLQPTRTFSGAATLTIGNRLIELVEAHGETDDQLFVWLPELEALMPGDNFYAAFPNLYTIRGTRARPIDAWIASLDAMRSRRPAILVPSHTKALRDRDEIAVALRDYRDAIQFLRDAVVQGANRLEPLEAMVSRVRLPPHLAQSPYLQELYGQVDWSVRAIYGQELGWFDGGAHRLYPPSDVVAREIGLMGGSSAVLAEAEAALLEGETRWATHLLGKLWDSGLVNSDTLSPRLAEAYRAVAADIENSNGRGYLLERALELEGNDVSNPAPTVGEGVLEALPAQLIFDVMATRLKTEQTLDVEAGLVIELSDERTWYVTVRRGVAEVVADEALPGTPAPVATVQTDSGTWIALALQVLDPAAAVAEGALVADDLLGLLGFLGHFEQGI